VGLCKSQNAAKIDAPMWAVLGAVNKLRNKIAHTFDQAQIKSRMGDLRTAYLAAISPTQAKDSEKLPDTSIVVAACGLCAAYLVVATDAAQTPKKT
jgi:hypothetical protein